MRTFLLAAGLLFAPASTLTLVRTIIMPDVPVGPYTDHLAVDLPGHRLFSTPQAHKSVYVFNLDTGALVYDLSGMGNPHSILYRPDLDRIYITDGGAGLLKVFDGRNYQSIKSIPLLLDADSIGYEPDTKHLYITNGGEGAKLSYSQLSIIDTTNLQHIGDIRIPAQTLEAMVLEKSGPRLYINITDKDAVGVIDRATRKLTATWPITKAHKNMAIALDEAHHRLFVGCRNTETEGAIVVFNTGTGEELETLPIDGWVDYMAFDPATHRLYASCGSGAGSVYVFEQTASDTYHLLERTATAPMAKTALLVPELHKLFVPVPHKTESQAKILVFDTH